MIMIRPQIPVMVPWAFHWIATSAIPQILIGNRPPTRNTTTNLSLFIPEDTKGPGMPVLIVIQTLQAIPSLVALTAMNIINLIRTVIMRGTEIIPTTVWNVTVVIPGVMQTNTNR